MNNYIFTHCSECRMCLKYDRLEQIVNGAYGICTDRAGYSYPNNSPKVQKDNFCTYGKPRAEGKVIEVPDRYQIGKKCY